MKRRMLLLAWIPIVRSAHAFAGVAGQDALRLHAVSGIPRSGSPAF